MKTPEERAAEIIAELFKLPAFDDIGKQRSGVDLIAAAIREAVEEEREACAQMADEHGAWTRSFGAEKACEMICAAIRARSVSLETVAEKTLPPPLQIT